MNLESALKYFSPKSPVLGDSTPATASDSLTISDVMGAGNVPGSSAIWPVGVLGKGWYK